MQESKGGNPAKPPVNRPKAVTINRLSKELAASLVGLDQAPQWKAVLEWLDREEKGLLSVIGAMNRTAEAHVWDRQIGEVRGVLLALRLLKALPSDARVISEAAESEAASM